MDYELKRWKERYLPALKKLIGGKAASELPEGLPRAAGEAEGYIRARLLADDERELCRAVCVDGEPVGIISITACRGIYKRTAELGFFIAPEHRRKGIMGAALAEAGTQAFERLSITRIDAMVAAGNTAARCALNAAGWSLEGVLRRRIYADGEYDDACVYALLRDE